MLFSAVLKVSAQEPIRRNLKGKVIAVANDIEGIYVVNIQTKKATITELGGYFAIDAAPGDTLMLSSIRFKGLKVGIAEADLIQELMFVKMEPLMHQLDEVTVFQYKNINAVALGIIPKGQKIYTPAERKVRTATGLDAKIGLNTSLAIDPLFNLLSGRTAMLKKNVLVEKMELLLDKIDDMYDNEYFTKLKIPAEHVRGFKFYIVENTRFISAVNLKNKTLATFLMGELAEKYLEITTVETK